MQSEGVIDRYEAERGFGFIRCEGRNVFFHIRDFRASGRVPAPGMAVQFEEIHVGAKGPRAMAVSPKVSTLSERRARSSHADRHAPRVLRQTVRAPASTQPVAGFAGWVLLWLALLAWAGWQRAVPITLLLVLPLLNLVTFFAYWWDKDAARKRHWRTPEKALHLLALLGGWPGAGWGQQLLRHKSNKASFRQTYWYTVALNFVFTAAWALWWPQFRPLTGGLLP